MAVLPVYTGLPFLATVMDDGSASEKSKLMSTLSGTSAYVAPWIGEEST